MKIKKILPILLPPIIVLTINYTFIYIYSIWESFDVLMHTLGGIAITISVIQAKKVFKIQKETWWYHALTTIALVTLAATIWEFYEFIMDYIDLSRGIIFNRQPSVADTMDDYKNAILGSIATLAIYRNKKS